MCIRLVAAAPLIALALWTPAAIAQPYGLGSVAPIGPFLDGALPAGTPGTAYGSWTLALAFPNLRFDDPLTFTPEPGTSQLFVGSRDGLIESFENHRSAATKQVFLDLRDRTAVVWDGGFLGLAFHPDWGDPSSPQRGSFYVYYTARAPGAGYPTGITAGFFNCYLRLSRFTRPDGSAVADPGSEQILFDVRLYNASHRGGGLLFGDDGLLYLSIGDQFRYSTAQPIDDDFEGGVVRVDVDQRGGAVSHPPRRRMGVDAGYADETSGNGYFIPSDNPFLDPGGGVFEEFWTTGHRAPHRMTIDRATGRLWSAEIGENTREEVNVIRRGGNYQWPFMEGLAPFPATKPPQLVGVEQPPVLDFTRSEAQALVGGHVYRGSRHPSLDGAYLCGDHVLKTVWAVTLDASGQSAAKQALLTFTPGFLSTFGQDHAGEVYLCGLGDGVPIHTLDRQNGYPEAPALLSQTGAFVDLATLAPAAGLIPYDVNAELWSDGTTKRRWLAVPNDGTPNSAAEQIAFREQDEWAFPQGTVLVKHFETPQGRRLETRLLVHGVDTWYGLTYRWDAAGTDANLLTGSYQETVQIGANLVPYYYPSRTDCLLCHTPQSGFVNGVKTRQLNGDFTYPSTGIRDNQLRTLNALGLFTPPLDETEIPDMLRSVGKEDASAPLELRVRSYLDANCAQCHRAGVGRASMDLRLPRALPFQGVVDGAVSDGLGIAGARVVAPGSLPRSILYQRLSSLAGCCAMPPLGKGILDADALLLVQRWIQGLDPAATGGAVAQSSTGNGGAADRAVDGDIDGVFANGSVTHSNTEFQPYWQADLGTDFVLERARLWNRTDCCSGRLTDFWVLLAPDPILTPSLATALALPGVTARHFPGTVTREELIDLQATGRYLRVQLAGTEALSLAEVQPFGHTVGAGVAPGSLVQRIARAEDDAEERLGPGSVDLYGAALELGHAGNEPQLVGLRFRVNAPQGATIEAAHLAFVRDPSAEVACALTIRAEASDDAPPLRKADRGLSRRLRTAAAVAWAPPFWSRGAHGTDHRTPDLAAVVQEVVDRPGWRAGNAILLLLDGSGTRSAAAFDRDPAAAPVLAVDFTVAPAQTVTLAIARRDDDAEQRTGSGWLTTSSSDLELADDGGNNQLVGLRFALPVPAGARLQSATLQFTADETDTGPAQLWIQAAAEDDAAPIGATDLLSRPRTTSQVGWVPAPWSVVGAAGPEQRTPDFAAVLQEILDRPGWQAGQHVLVLVSGTGERTAEAYDGKAGAAAQLTVGWD